MDMDDLAPSGYFSEFSWHSFDEDDDSDGEDLMAAPVESAQLIGVSTREQPEQTEDKVERR